MRIVINRIANCSLRKIKPGELDKFTSKSEIQHKKEILEYLTSYEDCAFTSEPVFDLVTKKKVRDADNAKTDGVYTWYWSEIYHFDKYNLCLKDEFINHVLKSINLK